MAKKNLTDAFCKSVTSGGKPQADFYDLTYPGLCFRVSSTQRKTWTFIFTAPQDAARARFTMGTYPNITLENARLRYRELEGMVRGGKDPRVVDAKPVEKTIRQLVAERVAVGRRLGWRAIGDTEQMLTANVLPVIGDMSIRDFRRRHLNQVIEPILARGANVMANRVAQQMKALMNFAVENEEIEFNPIAQAKWAGERVPTPEAARNRWLTVAEIKKVWANVDYVLGRDAKSGKRTPTIIKLCLATGQRLGEVCGMSRAELDMRPNKRTWTIPAARSKNGHEHVVPLNDLAMMLVSERLSQTNGNLLFHMHNDSNKPVPVTAVSNVVRYGHDDDMWGVPVWTPHDLRRTVASQMSIKENNLNIPDFNISKVLNHRSAVSGSITHQVYIQNDYMDEKREALDKWGRFLANLVGVELEQREAA